MKNLKLTPAQNRFIEKVKNENENEVGYQGHCTEFGTRDALLKRGLIVEQTMKLDHWLSAHKCYRLPVKETPLTLAECRMDYVLAYDNNGTQQRVKRGKELIQFMIKNN